VYFTAGIDNEQHGLFGALTPARPGAPEGPAEAQKVTAAVDVVQLDLATLTADISGGASASTIAQDRRTLEADFGALVLAEQQFARDQDGGHDAGTAAGAGRAAATQAIDRLFAALPTTGATGLKRSAAATQALDRLFAEGGGFGR
jgi:hypothetical protein